MNIKNQKKVIIAMSGGVDSSVSAWLLKQDNYHVEGLFMKNWEEDDHAGYCNSAQDILDAENVCKKLKICLHKINFSAEYWDKVFKIFLHEYKNGKTPNPDILCNKEIKFKMFLNYSINELKADYIATGHYAQIKKFKGKFHLFKGLDKTKDQSYFLYTLNNIQLKKILFPVGNLKKQQVRMLARKIDLNVADKKDSTGICFIGPRKITDFLQRYIPQKKGNIINVNGEIVGNHKGAFFYTIGQRKNLGIGGIKEKYNLPWYVVEKDTEKNILLVAQGIYNQHLMSIGLIAENIHWINKNTFSFPITCMIKTRYRQKDISGCIKKINPLYAYITFHKPVRAIAPGQAVVFYLSEECIGGGIIKSRIPLI